ncbi:MAG: hypothetical protein ACTSP1_19895 [Candidatus Freyarchaeota archaeon]
MKNDLLVTMAIEYDDDDDGGAVYWHVISISPRTGAVYIDLKYVDDRVSTFETIHNEVFHSCSARQRAATVIKPLPDAQLRQPTPKEISKYRARTP